MRLPKSPVLIKIPTVASANIIHLWGGTAHSAPVCAAIVSSPSPRRSIYPSRKLQRRTSCLSLKKKKNVSSYFSKRRVSNFFCFVKTLEMDNRILDTWSFSLDGEHGKDAIGCKVYRPRVFFFHRATRRRFVNLWTAIEMSGFIGFG